MPKRLEHYRDSDDKHFKRAINRPNLKATFRQFARVQVRDVPKVADYLEEILDWPRRELESMTLGEALPFLELQRGLEGEFKALADIMDRIHGKATQTVQNNVQGEVFHIIPPPSPPPKVIENEWNSPQLDETPEEREARFARYRKEEKHANKFVDSVNWDEDDD